MLNQSTFTRRNFLAGAGTVAAAVAAGLAWQPESAEAAGSGALGVYAGEYDQSERNQEDASGEQPTGADLLAEVEAATGSYTPGTTRNKIRLQSSSLHRIIADTNRI